MRNLLAFALLVVAGSPVLSQDSPSPAGSTPGSAHPAAAPLHSQWEYKTIHTERTGEAKDRLFKDVAKSGWELVYVSGTAHIFKRPFVSRTFGKWPAQRTPATTQAVKPG